MGGEVVTRELFDAQMGRLIVLKGWPDSVDEHFGALHDIPADLFTAAVDQALKTRTWFPVPAELRADADMVRLAVRVPLPAEDPPPEGEWIEHHIRNPFGGPGITVRVNREWRHDCETCSDTGFASVWCGDPNAPQRKPWYELRTCDRRGAHYAHEWVRQCTCWDTNRTLIRRREAQRKYAEKPGKAA